MLFSRALQTVFNTKGGGQRYMKPWGLPRLTQERKHNRRKAMAQFRQNLSVLRMAAAAEPTQPVRLAKPLPATHKAIMARRMDATRQLMNLRAPGGLLPPAARVAAAPALPALQIERLQP